jgi:hypothetical protein
MKNGGRRRGRRRFLSILLTLTLIFSTCSITAFAANDDEDKTTVADSGEKADKDYGEEEHNNNDDQIGDDQTGDDQTGDALDTLSGDTSDDSTPEEDDEQKEEKDDNSNPNESKDETETKTFLITYDDESQGGFKNLTEAYEASSTGDTIQLTENATIKADEKIIFNKDVTVDLNGKTLTVEGSLIILKGTFENGELSEGANGKIKIYGGKFSFDPSSYRGDCYEQKSGSEYYEVTQIDSKNNSAPLYSKFDNTIIYYDKFEQAFDDVNYSDDGTVYFNKSPKIEYGETVTIDSSINLVTNSKGIDVDTGGTLIIDGGTIDLSVVLDIKGTVIVKNNGTINESKHIYVHEGGVLNIEGGEVCCNYIQVYKNAAIDLSSGKLVTSYIQVDSKSALNLNISDGEFDTSSINNKGTVNITITGGTFYNFNPANYVKEPYEAIKIDTEDGSNVWEVVNSQPTQNYVAMIGDTGYSTLQEAIQAATASDTIKLLTDVTIDSDLTLLASSNATKGLTFDFDGHDITVDNATLTIFAGTFKNVGNINVDNGGKIDILGGTYSFDPKEYLRNGYKAPGNETNGYTVIWPSAVAYINVDDNNAVYYPSISEAVDAAKDGQTIFLFRNYSTSGVDNTINIDRNITLQVGMANYTLTINGELNLSDGGKLEGDGNIVINGEVNVKDGGYIGNTNIENPNITLNINVKDGGALNIEGGEADYSNYNVAAGGTITMSSGKIVSQKDYFTVADGATLTIKDGSFVANNNSDINISAGDNVNITGGTFTNYNPEELLKDPYQSVLKEENVWVVKEKEEEVITTVTITVYNLYGDGEMNTYTYDQGTKIYVAAVKSYKNNDANTTYTFKDWINKDTREIVSNNYCYVFTVNENITLEAEFEEEPKEAKTSVQLDITATAYGTSQISFEATRMVSDNTSIKEAGIIYGTKASVFDNLEDIDTAFTLDNSNTDIAKYIYKKVASSTSNLGIYIIKFNVGAKLNNLVYARAYVILNDGTIKYSPVVSESYNSLMALPSASVTKSSID